MGYNFFDLAQETFKAVKKPLSINDLWKKAVELGFADKVKTTGKTPWQTLGAKKMPKNSYTFHLPNQ